MRACPDCAARGLLLARLAGHIDRSVDTRTGERARDLLALDDAKLAAAVHPGGPGVALAEVRSAAAGDALEASLERRGCWSVCRHDPRFPGALDALGEARPRALFGAGDFDVLARPALNEVVTIVGSRRAGAYGRETARRLARLLAGSGLTVLSGLALGVDSEAHEGALAAGGETIAVLGTGPERAYPRSRRNLYERIRRSGVVISELPPSSPTFRWMFPARNRLMAALGAMTIVVEAAERSGSLITTEMAIDCGRMVGAVPGPVTSWRSSGANMLLAEGAAVIRGAQDALDLLLGPGAVIAAELGPPIAARERAVLDALEAGATSPDAVVGGAGIGFAEALAALGSLERMGYVRGEPTGRISRTGLRVPTARPTTLYQ